MFKKIIFTKTIIKICFKYNNFFIFITIINMAIYKYLYNLTVNIYSCVY